MFMSINPVTLKRELRSVKEQIEDLLKPAVADAPARLVLIGPDIPANSGFALRWPQLCPASDYKSAAQRQGPTPQMNTDPNTTILLNATCGKPHEAGRSPKADAFHFAPGAFASRTHSGSLLSPSLAPAGKNRLAKCYTCRIY